MTASALTLDYPNREVNNSLLSMYLKLIVIETHYYAPKIVYPPGFLKQFGRLYVLPVESLYAAKMRLSYVLGLSRLFRSKLYCDDLLPRLNSDRVCQQS